MDTALHLGAVCGLGLIFAGLMWFHDNEMYYVVGEIPCHAVTLRPWCPTIKNARSSSWRTSFLTKERSVSK